jgi:Mlc titration factor MtfA (ptsG expression regulator)
MTGGEEGMAISRKKRRRALMKKELPAAWLSMVKRNVLYYSCLPPAYQARLQGLVQVFLREKHFEGCGGLEITDEIRLTVAAQACVLLLGLEDDFYPRLQSILVYPSAYIGKTRRRLPDGTVIESPQIRLGETWSQGSLVLTWDDVQRGAYFIHNGHNVVLHEFAHQLDLESGGADGTPLLPSRSRYTAWARVLGREYGSFLNDLEHHRRTLLDEYGATDPAEFFAVATEFFFEKSIQLRERHPALYEQLKLFYKQDPASWPRTC